MSKRLYYKPSNNVNEVRRRFLEVNSELLEIALYYIWHKELDNFKNGVIKYIDKKRFGGKVVKQEYHDHINDIKNTIRKNSRNSLSYGEAKEVIAVLKEALNNLEDDQQLVDDELIDFIYELTNQYIQLHKHEEGIKRLINSNESTNRPTEDSLNDKNRLKVEKLQRFYWLNVDSTGYEWSFNAIKIGKSQTYSNLNDDGNKRKNPKCFQEIKVGDFLVSYETGEVRAITTLCKVIDKHEKEDEIFIEFQKVRDYENFLELEILRESKELENCEVIRFHRGTLFELKKEHYEIIVQMLEEINTNVDTEEELYQAVRKVMKDDKKERKTRLESRSSIYPDIYEMTVKVFRRNLDVIAEVLIRANGICERCGKEAPFNRATDGSPYLEVHHIKKLSDGGEDTVENAMAVCPNCHRELHFG